MRARLPWRRWAAAACLLVVILASLTPPSRGNDDDGYTSRALLEEPDVKRFTFLEQGLTATATTLRGLSGRSLLAPTTSPTPASINMVTLPLRAPVVAVALITIPGTHKYLMTWRSQYAQHNNITGTIDLDTYETTPIPTVYNQWCHGPAILADGTPMLFGGWPTGTPVLKVGVQVITRYDAATNSIQLVGNMSYPRWYASTCRLPSGKVLIVGGTDQVDYGNTPTVSEIWDPANPAAKPTTVKQPEKFTRAAGFNWYPFITLLPRGEILWWGDRGGSITDDNFTLIRDLPPLPDSFPYSTMYQYTASIVLHALKPNKTTGEYDTFSMSIFGGAPYGANTGVPASDVSARLDFYYCDNGQICDKGWVIEGMANNRRVMPAATVAPNGKIVVHGGGRFGRAGLGYKAISPGTKTLVYDPDAEANARFTVSDTDGVARMYHFSQCLDISGMVLVAGCETCGKNAVLPKGFKLTPNGDNEFRMTMGMLYEVSPAIKRPAIKDAPQFIQRGEVFEVSYQYTGNITGASLAAPCASTHSMDMGQRVILLVVESAKNGVARIRAPPVSQPAVAPFGYYMLFLLGDDASKTYTGRTYSEGVWVQLEDA